MSKGNSLPFCRHDATSPAMSSRKVNFQETVFEFGDDLNDLNSLEMQVSYQEIELRVRFANKA